MKWIPTPNSDFPERLHFETLGELAAECERWVKFASTEVGRSLTDGIVDDDCLECMAEKYSELDLFASLPAHVDGQTEFFTEGLPKVSINARLASEEGRRNRYRTSLAHEAFHAVYHRRVWEVVRARNRARNAPTVAVFTCNRATMIEAPATDWLEFQAGYGSVCILMPKSQLTRVIAPLDLGNDDQMELAVAKASSHFQVSEAAARWRVSMFRRHG